jgi:hypothetical protein
MIVVRGPSGDLFFLRPNTAQQKFDIVSDPSGSQTPTLTADRWFRVQDDAGTVTGYLANNAFYTPGNLWLNAMTTFVTNSDPSISWLNGLIIGRALPAATEAAIVP